MLHVGIFYRAEESFCATNPNHTFFRAAKSRHLICLWGWSSGTSSATSLLLPGLWGWFTLRVSQFVFAEPASVSGRLDHLGAQGSAEMMPWGSHTPEDMEGTFSTWPRAVTCLQVT